MRIALLLSASALIVPLSIPAVSRAQGDVRQFEKDGVRYRETRTVQRTPVTDVQWQERKETVYVSQPTTEVREYERTVYAPVVTYRCEPRWHGLLNPFVGPYVAYHMIPDVRWQARVEKVQVPHSYRAWVPETRIVKTPVRMLGFEDRERTSVVRIPPSNLDARVAARPLTGITEHVVPLSVNGQRTSIPPVVGVSRMDGGGSRAALRPSDTMMR